MRYSIIIPSWNNFNFLSQCIDSVIRNTKNYELIVVLNGSSGQALKYLENLEVTFPHILHFYTADQLSFSKAVNMGLSNAKGDYLILLNDDTLVTPGWADILSASIAKSGNLLQVHPVGIIGPVSNNAGGHQAIECDQYQIQDLDHYAPEHAKRYACQYLFAGVLSGFCMMITRACFNAVGYFDIRFQVGGWEDNDYCLRAYKLGFKSIVDQSVFIHHFGQTSLKRIGNNYDQIFQTNRIYFITKHYDDSPQKLIVILRTHNDITYLPRWLRSVQSYADAVCVVFDRCIDSSQSLFYKSNFPTIGIDFDTNFNEKRDRDWLVKTAVEHGATWILSLDADELLEDSFTREYVNSLMHPRNPEIMAYIFNFRNLWLGTTHYRIDGVFGQMVGHRMFKVVPNMSIQSSYDNGLHCTHVPMAPHSYLRHIRSRILHFGYNSPEKCLAKYAFYTALDPYPNKSLVGPQGYSHLISRSVMLRRLSTSATLSLCMLVKNEAVNLFNFLIKYYYAFDQIVIVDTGSEDYPDLIAETFGAEFYNFTGKFDFSAARNFAKSKCKSDWLLSMDCDEDFKDGDFHKIYDLLEDTPDGYLFQVANFMPDGSVGYSDNVRLIRNLPHIKWDGLVHENVSKSVSSHGGFIALAPINIRHFGYLKPPVTQTKKSDLYYKLLTKQILNDPSDPLGHFHLAFFYREKHNYPDFIRELKRSLELQPKFFLSQKELGLYYLTESEKYFKDLADTIPEGHFFYEWSKQISVLVSQALKSPVGNLS